jgi:hypothetical protein
MALYEDLREGLARALAELPDLQESAYMLSKPTPPYAEVVPAPVEYDQTFSRGQDLHRFLVRVLVGNNPDKAAQKRLDTFINGSGRTSVKAALEADRSLGGVAQDCFVRRCSGYRNYGRPGGVVVLGCEWEVEVRAQGDT